MRVALRDAVLVITVRVVELLARAEATRDLAARGVGVPHASGD